MFSIFQNILFTQFVILNIILLIYFNGVFYDPWNVSDTLENLVGGWLDIEWYMSNWPINGLTQDN